MSVPTTQIFRISLITQLIINSLASPALAADYIVSDGEQTLQLGQGDPLTYDILDVSNTTGGEVSLTIRGAGNAGDPDRGAVVFSGIRIGYGSSDTGTLNVDNGASVTSGNDIYVGAGISTGTGTGTGTLNVDNGASVASSRNIYVGAGMGYGTGTGTGTLHVDNGASVDSNGSIYVGYSTSTGSDTGTMNVDNDASVDSNGSIYIGYSYDGLGTGKGTMSVDNGALVASNNNIYVGYGLSSGTGSGVLNVDNGALVTSDANLYVGYGYGSDGTGMLNIVNGASVLNSGDTYIGYGESFDEGERRGKGYGTLSVGADALVASARDIYLGYGFGTAAGTVGTGKGTLNVNNDASVTSGRDIIMGYSTAGFGSGVAIVSNGGTLQAEGVLRLYNGILNIGAREEDAPAGAGHVSAGSGVQLSTGTFSTGDDYAGQIYFNHTDKDYVFAPDIRGEGFVSVLNGDTTLTGNNTYAGSTIIRGGTLRAGGTGAFSGQASHYMTREGVLDLNGFSQTVGTLSSSGTLYLNQKGDTAGTLLTINGDYHGYGGTLVFNTVLEGDHSLTDALHVTGNADGSTHVQVNNLGGAGAQTIEGIKLISVDGDIAVGTAFSQVGRIVAGAYDYRLVQGGLGGHDNSWYLTSGQMPVDPEEDPATPVDPELPDIPDPILPDSPGISTSRPEAGSYISNLSASEMFFTRMEDRGREHYYTDALSGTKKLTSLWLRSEGRHLSGHDSSGQLSTGENRYAVQMGGDMTDGSFTGTDAWRLGLMAGYGTSRSRTQSGITGYRSRGSADGYNMGLYGSWFENADRRRGAWVDTWLQYVWFSNRVQGEGLAEEKYRSGGLQASVETGYTFLLTGGKDTDYLIEPQAQLIRNGVKTNEHREANGTVVKSEGGNNIHTRLGLKGGMEIRTGEASGPVWKPYVALGWLHNTRGYGVKMDDISLSSAGSKNMAELKTGVEGQLTEAVSVWGSAGVRLGSENYRDLGGMLGVRYGF